MQLDEARRIRDTKESKMLEMMGMRCPYCAHFGTRVLDSRPSNENRSIRRRRECESCQKRFTTFETVEEAPIMVIKKDGTREEFSREKLLRGIIRACEKRHVSIETLENLVNRIENELRSSGKQEHPSKEIGEKVMDGLYDIDEVAYVRFASVYRQFKDINVFIKELTDILRRE